jgi:GMP reductase
MHILDGTKLDFDDVLIMPKRSPTASRKDVNLHRKFKNKTIHGISIIVSNMDATGTFKMADSLSEKRAFTCLHKHYTVEEYQEYFYYVSKPFVFYSLGISDKDLEKLEKVMDKVGEIQLSNICVDVANGYTNYFVDRVKKIRDAYPKVTLMAGNVVTPEMTQELVQNAGVDIVKVGIGPGSVCETRRMTGIGYPQLSAIIECADAAHGQGALICADGGCKNPGDVVKCMGAGADFVMLGGLFAGCEECEGEWEWGLDKNEVQVKTKLKFYGMSSKAAMDKHNGGVATYKASEGKEMWVDYKGPAADVLQEICGGLRSACAYVGAKDIKDFSKKTTFVRKYR